MFSKIANIVSKGWKWLSGKKRRIALLSGLVTQIAKPHTLAYQAAQVTFYLFGGADVVESGNKIIKDKLPGGLAK